MLNQRASRETTLAETAEHPVSSYVQKVKIALRERGVPFTAEVPAALGSRRAGGIDVLLAGLRDNMIRFPWPDPA